MCSRLEEGTSQAEEGTDAEEEVHQDGLEEDNQDELRDGRWFTLDNRRLAVFRLLEMCGRVASIKVEVVPLSRWAGEWNKKMTSTNGGAFIRIRSGNYQIGRNKQETNVPWLEQIRNAQPREVMSDAQFSTFLANFTDE